MFNLRKKLKDYLILSIFLDSLYYLDTTLNNLIIKRTLYQRKFSCPAVVTYRREKFCDTFDINEYNFTRDRSVDSDDGDITAEAIVETLDKLKVINTTVNKQKNRNRINRKAYGGMGVRAN